MKLGIFDSGIGGEAVATSLRITFPDAKIVTVSDSEHMPYGDRSSEEIINLTDQAIQPLLTSGCDIIVIACNTATAVAIETLREKYPKQKFIGIEPMIKTAASLTRTNVVAVFATPATLSSKNYEALVHKYATHLTIVEPDCSQWAYLIENNEMNHEHIKTAVDDVCNRGADVIVLGCTHYHWIKDLIALMTEGRAQILEPSDAIGRRVQALLQLS